MPAPFETLAEMLLRGGIAPRHVKRYLRELSEHLADLTAEQRAAGFDASDAAARARAALGPDADLADAMLKQRDFRAFSARFPWAVFLLTPPFALILGYILWLVVLILLGRAANVLPTRGGPVPGWFATTVANVMFAADLVVAPALAWALAWVAQRQRLRLIWPLLGIGFILSFGFHANVNISAGSFGIALRSISPLLAGSPFGDPAAIHWPTLLTQALLLGMPVLWLLWPRHKPEARA